MKIAFVVHEYNRHIGHARYVAELASRFKAEHEIHVFTSEWEEPDPEGIHFHYVPAWRWKTLTSVITSIIPSTFIIPRGFDIIHSQGLCGFRHDLSTVHCIQTQWLRSLGNQDKTKKFFTPIWKWIVAPLERLSLSSTFSKRVIVISRRVQEDLANDYGRSSGVDLIYHGVDLIRFNPLNKDLYRVEIRKQIGVDDCEKLALFVGNLQKGASIAIRSVARIPSLKLLLVSGSNNEREKKLVSQLGIEDRVIWQPLSREIEKYFASVDCLIYPTPYDAFGMVISEAMATGLPVITSKWAGASELIQHGDSGWLVEDPWNVDQITEGLAVVFKDTFLRNRMGNEARRAIETYTWDRCAAETIMVYKSVLQSKRNRLK